MGFFFPPFPASFSDWFVTQQCQFTSGTNRTNLSFGLGFTNSLVLDKHILCPSLPDAHAPGERQGLLKVLPLYFCTVSNISSPSVFFYKEGLLGSLPAASSETPPRPGVATRAIEAPAGRAWGSCWCGVGLGEASLSHSRNVKLSINVTELQGKSSQDNEH